MSELFQHSTHALNAFVFVIVGNGKLPASLYACLWAGDEMFSLPWAGIPYASDILSVRV